MNQNEMMLQYLMEMGAMSQEGEEQARRQAQIDALRKAGRVDTGMQGGRIQRAAPPLAHLANAYQNMQANSRQDALDADRKKMGENRMETLRRMTERFEQQQAARQQPVMPANADAQAFRDMTGGLY